MELSLQSKITDLIVDVCIVLSASILLLILSCALRCLCCCSILAWDCCGLFVYQEKVDDFREENVDFGEELTSSDDEKSKVLGLYLPTNIKDEPADDTGLACIICLTNKKIIALIPCGHVEYCYNCVKQNSQNSVVTERCPHCDIQIESFQRVFY